MNQFSPSFTKFFKELEKNNTSEWFDQNRKTYETEVKKPFAEFVQDMITRIGRLDREVKIKPSEAIMRINKDIRFSKDKTPYNTYVAANISAKGKKDKSYPGFYFSLSHKGISMFGGAYMPENTQIEKIRNHIIAHSAEFRKIYAAPDFKKKFGTIKGDQSKRVSPELKSAAEKEPLVLNKQFYFSADLGADNITKSGLAETLMDYFSVAEPFNNFLKRAIS